MDLPSGIVAIGPDQGHLTIHTHREGLGARAGHDLVIEATRWEGTLEVESPDGPRGHLEIRVDAGSLEVRDGKGGAKPLSDKDRRDIVSNLQSKVLHADAHPEIRFHAEGVTRYSATATSASGVLEGSLEMNGRTQPVSAELELERAGGRLRVRGGATVRQTRWGIKPYTALLGALRVADEVEIAFDLALPTGTG